MLRHVASYQAPRSQAALDVEAHVDVDARRRVAVFDERDPRRLDDLHGAARRRALELARERAEPRRPRGPEDDDVDL